LHALLHLNFKFNFFSVPVYNKLRAQREQNFRHLSSLSETVADWRSANPTSVNYFCDKKTGHLIPTTVGRRSAAPLDIVSLPGFEKLSEEERELCSESRVHPETYLEIKDVLVAECAKGRGLRLADARPLVKIDVNKTRKLFDFLLKKNLIFLPEVKPEPVVKTEPEVKLEQEVNSEDVL
jgi:transcriptional adapter 2-alpha